VFTFRDIALAHPPAGWTGHGTPARDSQVRPGICLSLREAAVSTGLALWREVV
jgi:hypothetical protein